MSDTSPDDFFTTQAAHARGPESPRRRRRRTRRWLMAGGAGVAVVAVAGLATAYLYASSLASDVHRIHVPALDAKHQPPETSGSETILLTDSQVQPGEFTDTGLIEILHLNAVTKGETSRTGSVVSIPADAVVNVPGNGQQEIGQALAIGGPSLLVQTVEQLTGARIDHYADVDFATLPKVISAVGGVTVDVPYATQSEGFWFPAGTNTITRANALAYARQPDVSELVRAELQMNLLRAIINKIASNRLFATNTSVLNAVANAVSVDSDLSNAQLVSLALSIGTLQGSDVVFVDAPVSQPPSSNAFNAPVTLDPVLSPQLWSALRSDEVATFAQQNPDTVTPSSPA
jgi:LCP family protein required for cell wall assembly